MKNKSSGVDAVVLIHAFPLNASQWAPQTDVTDGSIRMFTPDLPGFGTQPGLDEQAFSMELAAEYIGRELQVQGIDTCILGGLSMGGYVAFECWRQFPEKISGMLLANTKATADSPDAVQARYDAVEQIGAGHYTRFVDELIERLVSPTTRQNSPDVVGDVRAMMLRAIPDSVIAALLGIAARRDSTGLLSTISIPVSIVVGADDAITTGDDARSMHSLLPESSLTVIEKVGHLSNLESPNQFNAALSDLIARIDG